MTEQPERVLHETSALQRFEKATAPVFIFGSYLGKLTLTNQRLLFLSSGGSGASRVLVSAILTACVAVSCGWVGYDPNVTNTSMPDSGSTGDDASVLPECASPQELTSSTVMVGDGAIGRPGEFNQASLWLVPLRSGMLEGMGVGREDVVPSGFTAIHDYPLEANEGARAVLEVYREPEPPTVFAFIVMSNSETPDTGTGIGISVEPESIILGATVTSIRREITLLELTDIGASTLYASEVRWSFFGCP